MNLSTSSTDAAVASRTIGTKQTNTARDTAAMTAIPVDVPATPKINGPAPRLPRAADGMKARESSSASTLQNLITEPYRSNENPAAILSDLSQRRPTLKQSASDYANGYLNHPKRRNWLAPGTRGKIDVNKLVLVDFPRMQESSAPINRFKPLHYERDSLKTVPLSQLFIANTYNGAQFDPDRRRFGVYDVDALDKSSFVTARKREFESQTQNSDPDVATAALSLERLNAALQGTAQDPRAGQPNNFPAYHQQQLASFFGENRETYAQARRDQLIGNIEQAAKRQADVAAKSIQAGADEPRFDKNDENMVRSALEGSVDGTVKVYPLRIGEHDSINAQRFTDHTGRTVLHMPGEEHPLRAFDDLQGGESWIVDHLRHRNQYALGQFAQQHFSRNDANNRNADPEQGVYQLLRTASRYQSSGMETATALKGDPFFAQAKILQEKTMADDHYDLTIAGTPDDSEKIELQPFVALAGDIAQGPTGKDMASIPASVSTPVPTSTQAAPGEGTVSSVSMSSRPRTPSVPFFNPSWSSRTSATGIEQLTPAPSPSAISTPPSNTGAETGKASVQLAELFAKYPSLPAAASSYARRYMKDVYKLDIDPDRTVLAEFSGRGRGRYVDRDLAEAKIKTLTQLFVDNFDNNATEGKLSPDAGQFGVYPVVSEHQTVRTGTADDPFADKSKAMPSLVDTQELFWDMTDRQFDPRAVGRPNKNHPNRFFEEFSKQRSDFFSAHREEITSTMRSYAHEQADAARGTALNEADYAMVRNAFNHVAGSDINVKSLKFEGFEATNSLLISNKNGRTVAYLPGEEKPFVTGNNLLDITEGVRFRMLNVPWTNEFIRTQFSGADAKELDKLDKVIEPYRIPTVTNISSAVNLVKDLFRDPTPGKITEGETIPGDPFENRTAFMIRKEQEDLSLEVKSNSELHSAHLLHNAGLVVPFPNTLNAILGQGKTQAEGKAGIGMDVATLPLLVLPVGEIGKAAATAAEETLGAAIEGAATYTREMSGNWPRIRLPQRVNGRLGYPLSPVSPPRLPELPPGTSLSSPELSSGVGPGQPVASGSSLSDQIGTDARNNAAGAANDGSGQLNEMPQSTALAPPGLPSSTLPRRPVASSASPSGQVVADTRNSAAGVVNEGFVDIDGDTTPLPLPPSGTTSRRPSVVNEQIEMHEMSGTTAARPGSLPQESGRPVTPEELPGNPALNGAQDSRRPSTASATSDINLDPDPSATQLRRATQIINSHGQTKVANPAWLDDPGWLSDYYAQLTGFVFPKNVTTVKEMVALQKQQYANMVNRHTMRLAQAYENKLPPTEISSLIEAQRLAQGEQKSTILSQWARVNPRQPMTTLQLNNIDMLTTRRPGFKDDAQRAVARLKLSQQEKQKQLATFLSRNMSNNAAVRARQLELQKQLDQELKFESHRLKLSLQKTQVSLLVGTTVTTASSGLGIWLYKHVFGT